MKMVDMWSLMDELAPLPVVLEAIRSDTSFGWPRLAAQQKLAEWFSLKKEYPLPHNYLLALMKALEKDISSDIPDPEEEEQFADDFLAYFLLVRSQFADEEDTGYQQFTILNKTQKLPIQIKRIHNQVGTKVWSAGLLLAEILQHECGTNLPFSLTDKSFIELGAGVGISSLLWFYSLSPEYRMKNLLITDYAWSVIELVDKNINISRAMFGDPATDHNIQSCLLDWTILSDDDVDRLGDASCLLAADCTYSPDLNTVLVRLFHTYFTSYLKRHPDVKEKLPRSPSLHALKDSGIFPMTTFLQEMIPVVLIACTLRNADTFTHFVSTLDDAGPQVSYWNITDFVQKRLSGKEMYYLADREHVEVFCIFPSSGY